jgi:signal transduction histidine kinase
MLLPSALLFAQGPVDRGRVDSLVRLARQSNFEIQVVLYDQISRLFWYRNGDSILYYSNLAMESARKDGSDISYGEAYNSMGNAYSLRHEDEKALAYYPKAIEYREKAGQRLKAAFAYSNFAITYKNLKRYSEAIDAYKQGARICNEIEDFGNEASMIQGIAEIYEKLNDLNKALEYSIKAANICLQHNIRQGLPNTYNFIGSIHKDLKNIDLAEEYYLKALALFREDNDIAGLSSVLNNLGIVYDDKGENQKAIDYYTKSLEYAKQLDNLDGVATSYNNIGFLYVKIGQIEKGLESYAKSLAISKDFYDKENYANTCNNIAAAHLKAGNLALAEKYVLMVLPFARLATNKAIAQESYQILSRIYSQRGQYKKAYEYLGLQLAYNDSLYAQQQTASIAEMQTRFETEAKEKEIQLLRKDNEIQLLEVERHKNYQKLLIITSVFFLFVSVGVFFGFYLKRKSNYLLSQKNKELEVANNKLKESENNLRELNATKDKFFSIIAHDLKNPFNALLGFSEILDKNYDSLAEEEKREYIGIIFESSQSLFKLLDNLLQWSRTQIGTIQYNPEVFNLLPLIKQEVGLLQINADKKKIALWILVNEAITAYADRNIIGSVIRNLLSNAIKFTDFGGRVELRAREVNGMVEVSVADSGIGIDPDDIDKLFQPDLSLSTRGTANEEGTGLGLILCKEFVERNNGRIWAKSERGRGSTFLFTLPTHPPANPESSGC